MYIRSLPDFKELLNEVLSPGRDEDVLGELERVLVIHDLAVGLDDRLCVERRVTNQHLVEDHADRPPVTLLPVVTVAALRA